MDRSLRIRVWIRNMLLILELENICSLQSIFSLPLYKGRVQNRVWRIFGYSNIFEYFPIRIFVRIIFVSFFWCEYIQIFVRIVFLIRIYSDIRSYHFFDTNIFGYSFVSFFGYKYIRIFVRIENLYSPHPAPEALAIPQVTFIFWFPDCVFVEKHIESTDCYILNLARNRVSM